MRLPTSPEQVHPTFLAAFNAGDLDALMGLYEPDAILVPSPGSLANGVAAIRQAFAGYVASKPVMSLETRLILRGRNIAVLHGKWTLATTGPDGNPATLSGVSTEVVRRQSDGSWLFAIDNPFTVE